ncbi:50S ribosomal protein L24 [Heliophilum fasciatum]|uniref:Large ribosomal subunit protein uL24 n=1 Tax=Heliophilum fasciatum TaxID=35700 RepID=A0A4R2RLA0_9FIRM|nr:50S ribosomal protein L24 [Heliophilum fasciatum]MCW2277805.1 large subunit ribosomal protein L24 [Heliophilum fasciatum]TCP64702.1 LSU ribosomal protein L24P [Heliophilum fasciatum]
MANAKVKVHVKKGDLVQVITGKDAGKKGKVIEVIPAKNRVVVEKVNIVKKHSKPSQALPQGGIQEKEAPIDASNVLIFCATCDRPVRIGHKFLEDGKKVRVCKKCGQILD